MLRHTAAIVWMLALMACSSSSEPETIEDPTPVEVDNPVAHLGHGHEVTAIAVEAFDHLLTAPSPKPRIVNFWATWCPPCVAELPELEAYAKAHPEVDVVLVNTDHPSLRESKVRAFLERREIQSARSTQLDVSDQATALAEHVPEWPNAIPYTMVIKTDGSLAHRFTTSITADQIEAAIDPL